MKAGWIGLGKLGLPCALALAVKGHHDVAGYDVSDQPSKILTGQLPPPAERGISGLLSQLRRFHLVSSVAGLVAVSDIVVVAVQTPHAPQFGGEQPAPQQREDFEYAYLVQAVRDVVAAARSQERHITLVVLSTTLPGTINRLIRPLAGPWTTLVYSPAFISLGTTIGNFCKPEFIICGSEDGLLNPQLAELYEFTGAPLVPCDLTTAELLKISYNMLITSKIIFANTIMELAHKTGADADAVTTALGLGYRGGMTDGGACRPRDLIALSWLAGQLGASYDLAGSLTAAREAQTRWLAQLASSYAQQADLPVIIMGTAYKPETNLTAGSPGLLLASMLPPPPLAPARTAQPELVIPPYPAVFVIATRHPEYRDADWPAGSVVLDPWGYIPDQQGVTVVRIGRR